MAESEDGREWIGPKLFEGQKSWSRGTKFIAKMLHNDTWIGFFDLSPDPARALDSPEHEKVMLKDF
jgi:hypothetical protein